MYNEDYYSGYENNTYKNNKFSLNNLNLKGKLILGFVLLIVLIIVLIGINSIKNYYNSYEYLEKKMISAAKNYITNSNFMIMEETYLDVTKLGFEVKKSCSGMSGVFVDSGYSYKAYLDCEDYQSDVVNNGESKVKLNGEEIVILGKDVSYTELGVSGNNQVNIQGEVGNDEGVYNLKYIVVSNNSIIATLTRKVVVIDEPYINKLYPSLILKGDKVEYVQKGHKYQEQGVFASDSVDLDLSSKVKTTGKVNVNTVGEYDITYTVTNSRGYSNNITRKVVVVNNFSTTSITGYLSTDKKTSGNVTIYLKVVGDNYDYMILPNGSKTSSKTIEYPVDENGTYNFISYDKDGKSFTKIVTIDNIDNTKPNASCVANVYNDYTQIYVTPYSGKKIKSYNYVINGVSSGEVSSSSYQTNFNDINSVEVILNDDIGNSNLITCEIIDMKKPVYTSNRCTTEFIYQGPKYTLTLEQKQKLAAMVNAEYAGDLEGMKAVASHMANMYEMRKWSNGLKSSLFDYISVYKWYNEHTLKATYYNELSMQAVEDCIVNGERTLPLYIDEFDWFPNDIINPLNIDDYERGVTFLYNRFGSEGTFWCISKNKNNNDANIFFYTSEEYKNYVGG